MNLRDTYFIAALFYLSVAGLAFDVAAEPAIVTVDAKALGPTVSPRMYGIFLEEINHGVDGGLYAELVRNRAFEDSRPPEGYKFVGGRWVDAAGFDSGFGEFGYSTDGIPFWRLAVDGTAEGEVQLETTGGVTKESSYCARLEVSKLSGGQVRLENEGFFGVGVQAGADYQLSLYARGSDFAGPLKVRLEDAFGETCSNEIKIEGIGDDWQQFEGKLTATRTDPKARLVIEMGATGRVWLDFVSLFPASTWRDRPNGLRADLAEMIAALRPGFVRFPGGCVVEGATVETAYDWKLTVGPVESRSERWGPWNYRRTQGLGLFEYLQFCEDLGAAPLYVGFCGQTCIFRERENVPMEAMGPIRDSFLDVVEYANGAVDSRWGALRAEAGHAEPFDLKLIEIGNENQGREYAERYEFIQQALAAKYGNLEYLADLSWTSPESMAGAKFDIEDRHYYNSPRWFATRFHEYDKRSRKLPPLYLGEVAVTTGEAGPQRGNLLAALSEGVFLMGCERNADAVQMVSYAPLLGHVEGRTALTGAPPPWHAMIYFDGTRIFGTVSYYLWQLMSVHRPDQMIAVETSFPNAKPPVIAGQVGIGTWDATAEFKDIRVERDGQPLFAGSDVKELAGVDREGGEWSLDDGTFRQGRRGFGLAFLGDANWADYTLSLKARKQSGGEGFLIVFGRKDGERFWWNLGGWGNSQHAIEMNQTPVGSGERGRIETDRWYDVKIALTGNRIRAFLDGELIHDVVAEPPQTFFVNAGRDDSDGALIVKAINLATEPQLATLQLRGVANVKPDAECIVLTSDRLTDNNSLSSPRVVAPKQSQVAIARPEFSHEFPPRSLTVLRIESKSK